MAVGSVPSYFEVPPRPAQAIAMGMPAGPDVRSVLCKGRAGGDQNRILTVVCECDEYYQNVAVCDGDEIIVAGL